MAEEALRQSQKMEAVGRLTGGIAHDFNNLLTVISSNIELLQRRLPGEATTALMRLTDARDGRRAARGDAHAPAAGIFAPAAAGSASRSMSTGWWPTCRICCAGRWARRSRSKPCWPAACGRRVSDANQLENALLNLAINARDAMPDGGKLTIETANAHLDDAYAAAHAEVTAGQYVMLAVTDTGTGMTQEVDRARRSSRSSPPSRSARAPALALSHGLRLRQAIRRPRHDLQRAGPGHAP